MAEKDKTLIELKKRLNAKLSGSGSEFIDIKEVRPGEYQLLAQMNKSEIDKKFGLDGESVKGLVRTKKVEPGSLLDRISTSNELEALQSKLEIAYAKDQLNNPGKEVSRLDIRYRDSLKDGYLDLRDKSAEEVDALKLYSRSEKEYYRTGIYGSTIDVLSNLSATGFYNEINNVEIKQFYDAWVRDATFITTVKKIFHNLYRYNVCYIMTAYGSYEPHFEGISSIPGKEPDSKTRTGLKASVAFFLNEIVKKETGSDMDFKKFSEMYEKTEMGAKGTDFPIAHTILDPKFISVQPLGFFNKSTITFKKQGYKQIKATMKAIEDGDTVSKSVKEAIKLLPSKLRAAIENDEDYTFDDSEISTIFLRKEDFEGYSKPKGARAFDSFDYKDELKRADFATVDGIYNYILKVTVGDKDNPVTDPQILENLAEAFNTPQKAFTIVWNHTLDIEKITSSEVGAILGKAKYEPVESDITAALGITRALIDGAPITGDAANLSVKAIKSEIRCAREQIEAWIYAQYRIIAKAAAFTTFPYVRWKEEVISTDSDAVTRASMLQALDRKALSIQTYMREVGLDYDTEVQRMTDEFPLIQDDILRAGSPFQKAAEVSPSGDSGRPKSQPKVKKAPVNKQNVVKRNIKVPSATQQAGEVLETEFLTELVKEINALDQDSKLKIIQGLIPGSIINTMGKEESNKIEPGNVEQNPEPIVSEALESQLNEEPLLEEDTSEDE
jgi:hypothetical protein